MIGKIIQLTPDDDIASIRDRIEWAMADRVALVLPDGSDGLRLREIDYSLLRRVHQQYGCDIAIVSSSLRQRSLANDNGLVSFRSISQAVQRRWLDNGNVEPIARVKPARRFIPGTLRRFYGRRNYLRMALHFVISVATLAVIVAAAFVLIPTAKVTLTASSQSYSLIVPVTLDSQIDKLDTAELLVPARRVDVVVEEQYTVPTTGAKDIPRGKSRGNVVFFNALATPYTVPKNTVVRTSSASIAVRFVTVADVAVPPAGRADAAVEAIDEGPGGNVPANQINRVEGLPALAVTVLNPNPTQGGGVETVHAVTMDDYKRARVALQDKLLQAALIKMKQDPEVNRNGWFVVPNTLFIADLQDETYDRFVTEQANEVTLNMRLQVAGLAISPSDLDTIAHAAVADKVPSGFSLLSVQTERGEVAEEGTGLRTEFFIVAHATAGAQIDENNVKKLVRGKTIADAQSELLGTLDLKVNPVITVEPQWLFNLTHRLPFVPLRIETQVKRE